MPVPPLSSAGSSGFVGGFAGADVVPLASSGVNGSGRGPDTNFTVGPAHAPRVIGIGPSNRGSLPLPQPTAHTTTIRIERIRGA